MSKHSLIAITVLLGIGIVWILASENNTEKQDTFVSSNLNLAVQEEGDQQQSIKILAQGGYFPNKINAVANKDTILKLETKGTYDCSSAISIPALNYTNNLQPTGITEVRIPADKAKDSIEILCSMGMYRATIEFKS
ncbi:cupredoxin domain-containing protein [Candidatus Gracilibacteria bacterium]|jgi:plastocyanin domain-containing protein|nr:cupredoxin domain-containing protein [Candidatus Gracilibacteria bacterium]